MASSAIGPGFLTQTAIFTARMGADFAAAILFSALLDIVIQLSVWRVLLVAQKRAPELANAVFSGSGTILTLAIAAGGLVFNIGNIAGAGLGLETMLGVEVRIGATCSAILVCLIYLTRQTLRAMDIVSQILGSAMILATLFVAWKSSPPLALMAERAIAPQNIDIAATLTLVGGTVGGYITFAGGHRLLEAATAQGWTQQEALRKANNGAFLGVLLATIMRVLLFSAALGVVLQGGNVQTQNPAASVFTLSLGNIGTILFGAVMWFAATTSILGSAYTSVSFLTSSFPALQNRQNILIPAFILLSACIFLLIGKPVQLLLTAGLVNSFILPFALLIVLLGARKHELVGAYRHPVWLTVLGGIACALLLGMSVYALREALAL